MTALGWIPPPKPCRTKHLGIMLRITLCLKKGRGGWPSRDEFAFVCRHPWRGFTGKDWSGAEHGADLYAGAAGQISEAAGPRAGR